MSKIESYIRESLNNSNNIKVGDIYKWGDWEYGWHGKIIIDSIDKRYIYFKNIYKEKDIFTDSNNYKKIDGGWYLAKSDDIMKKTFREFNEKKIPYIFVENYNDKYDKNIQS